MKVVLVGDVGGADGYHAGDEAMLEAAIDQLALRGVTDIVVISGDPADTTARYGVRAIARIDFADRSLIVDAARDRRLDAVLGLVDGTAGRTGGVAGDARPGDLDPEVRAQVVAVVEAIASSDGVVVTGGGNLSPSWPEHLYERVAVLEIARHLGVPSAVTGQTLGPDLTVDQAKLLGSVLGAARLVGLREQASFDLADGLLPSQTPRRLQLDDAMFLGDGGVASTGEGARPPRPDGDSDGFVALSLNPFGDDAMAEAIVDDAAVLVRRLHEVTQLPVRFVPHLGRFDVAARDFVLGDAVVGEQLLDRLAADTPFTVEPLLPARDLAALTRGAAAIVSTRYHPLVFGLAGGVPCLAIAQDHYTSVKLSGALRHAGLERWTVPLDAVTTGLAAGAFAELWRRRHEIAAHVDALVPSWRENQARHWDEVVAALSVSGPSLTPTAPRLPAPPALIPELAGLEQACAVARAHMSRTGAAERARRASFLEAERYAQSLEATLAARSVEAEGLTVALRTSEVTIAELALARAEIEARSIQLRDETEHAEQSAAAARSLAADAWRQLDESRIAQAETANALLASTAEASAHRRHLELLQATKTLRWTSGARRQWRRWRARFGPH